MKLLAIETASDACSVALEVAGECQLSHSAEPRRHAQLVMGQIDELLRGAGLQLGDLDAIVLGRGPGSFTGVRIGAAVAQGLAYGANVPVAPVSTLATIAQGAFRTRGSRKVLVAQDARMGEVYAGAFTVSDDGAAEPTGEECVTPPPLVPLPPGSGWTLAGTACEVYADQLISRLGPQCVSEPAYVAVPNALDTLVLGRAAFVRGDVVGAGDAAPVYVRDRVANRRAVD